MSTVQRAARHLHAVQCAMDCAKLGARVRTMHCLTGLPPRELQRLLFTDPNSIPRGRAPDSPEWYHGANLLFRTDASIWAALFQRLRRSGFNAQEALIGSYRHYATLTQAPQRISFDRAFDLASHLDGIWVAKTASFCTVTCPHCSGEFLAALGSVPAAATCPFCKLLQRYHRDPRLQSAFPARPMPDPSAMNGGWLALRRAHERATTGRKVDRRPSRRLRAFSRTRQRRR